MVSISWTSDSSSGATKGVEIIWCVDGQEPQMHEIWCLGFNGVTHEVHTTAQVDVRAGTVGNFTTNCLAEKGCIIAINQPNSHQWKCQVFGYPQFPKNQWIHVNRESPISQWYHRLGTRCYLQSELRSYPGVTYHNVSVAWHGAVLTHPAYTPRSTENPCNFACRVCEDSLHSRRCEHMRSPTTHRNPVRNQRVNCRVDVKEGPVDQ